MKKFFLILTVLTMSVAAFAQEKITSPSEITSGNKYYIGATTGDDDFYFYVDGTSTTESIKGVAKEDKADAVALTFTAVTGGWTIQFDNGNYLGLKNAKDNGAVQVLEEAMVWQIEENKGLLSLHPNDDFYLQKNNSGTQFGSYKNIQVNVWLEFAGSAPVLATFEGLVIKGKATKMEYEVGEAFDPTGLEVWGVYTKIMKGDSTSQIKSGLTWSIDPETFAEASDNASVTLSASYKDKTTANTTITGIQVNKPIIERDTVDIISNTMTYKDFIASNQAVQFYAGGDAEGYSTFLVTSKNATSVEGTFDIYVGYTFADSIDGSQISFEEGQITVTAEEKGIRLTGWAIGDNEKYYRLNWFKQTVIDERDTVDIVSTALQYYDLIATNKVVLYYATDVEGYSLFRIASNNVTSVDGTFKWSDGTINNPNSYFSVSGTDKTYFQDGEFTMVTTDEGTSLTGWMIGADEKYYRLNLSKKAGVLDYDTNTPFEAEFSYYDMEVSIENGVISIFATNAENLTIGLELYTDPATTKIPAGTYVISDSQEAGTALKSVGVLGGFLSESWAGVRGSSGLEKCWFIVEGDVTLSYDGYGKLKVVVNGTNSWGQPVNATIEYEKLEPKETVEINNADFYASNNLGVMKFYGSNDDNKFDLYVNTETTTGDFTDAIDFGDCKIFIADGSSIGVLDADEFKVVADGKNLTLTAKLLGSDTIQYNITATGYLGALEYDAKESYNGKFAVEEVTLTQTDTLVNIIGLNAAGDSVHIIVEGELIGGVLAAGEYTNIVASPGVYNFNFTPSFVLNEGAIWFIQSGKLTVADNGSMTFEGINSYDKNVTITIASVTAGITVNVTVPQGTPACYFYGEMSGDQFVEMTKLDDTHFTIDFPNATSIGWGYKFVWENGNWATANSDPEGDISVEPDNGEINIEIKAWGTVPAPAECKYTEYENWQIKFGPDWTWSDNMTKVEDGLFKMEIEWDGTGFNIKSDENPIKKDWFPVEELVIGEEVIAPVIVDVYLKVIDDEHIRIGIGTNPGVGPTDAINIINTEDVPNGAIIKDGKVYIIRNGKVYNLQGSEIKNADEILKSIQF